MEVEESSSTRYIILLEDTQSGRVARLAFPSQALYNRYLKKKDIKPKEVRCAYVELDGEVGEGLHAFYCQWLDEGPWEVSGYSLDGQRPVFPMTPHDVRSMVIPVVSPELLADDSFTGRALNTVSRVSRQLARPIHALDFDLGKELRGIPLLYWMTAILAVMSMVTFFVMRAEPPRYVEGVYRVPWLMNTLSNVSYFEGDGRLVFEGEMEPRAVRRAFKGLEVIKPGQDFVISRYTLYRDAGMQEEVERGAYWTHEGYDAWQKAHYANIKHGFARKLPNGSSLAYDFVTNRLYGNLRDASEIDQFTSATPTNP